jgi:hypothetical protein
MWFGKLKSPLGYMCFLWLLANNKVLTRENLAKRKHMDDLSCLFYCEKETVSHLFFECCVARLL